jgi:hypothetical protein
MSSSVLQNLGSLHIVTGRIIYTSGAPALTSNDASATVADTGSGNCTVTLGQAFRSAPAVVAQYLKATEETVLHTVAVEQATTTALEFRIHSDTAGTNALADPADGDGIMFMAVGVRDI